MTTVCSRAPVSGCAANATPDASDATMGCKQDRDAAGGGRSVGAPVDSNPFVVGRRADPANGIDDARRAAYGEHRLVLTGERRTVKVLGDRRGAYREGPAAEHEQRLGDRRFEQIIRR